MSIYLVCEGTLRKTDYRVLELILNMKLGKNILIEPVGSDSGLGVRQEQLQNLNPRSRVYVIEDRNFRDVSWVEERWNRTDKKRFYWSRHEIENYLLDPRVVFKAFEAIRSTRSGRNSRLPTTETGVRDLLEQVAREQIEHYVGLLLCRSELSSPSYFVGYSCNEPPSETDTPFSDRETWIKLLQQRGENFQQESLQRSSSNVFSPTEIATRYQHHLMRCTVPTFFSSGQFLKDMGGHELFAGLLQTVIRRLGVVGLKKKDFEQKLIEALDAVYVAGFFGADDDFVRLANKLV